MTSDDDAELHARLQNDDSTASAQVFDRFLTPLIEHLSRQQRFRNVASTRPELIWDAASDAIFAYVRNPASYHPTRGTLERFLRMSARGDLLNALAKEKRESGRQTSFDEDVGLLVLGGNILTDEATADDRLEEDEIWAWIAGIVPDETERAVVGLMLAGERNRDEFASALGILHLPEAVRRREVDRVKDRLKKRLQRARRARIGGT